jgi:phage-related protein (TIGR01555 family)
MPDQIAEVLDEMTPKQRTVLRGVWDGFENVINWIGTARDPKTWHRQVTETWMSEEELEANYYGNAYARRIITKLPNDSFKNGHKLKPPASIEDATQKEAEEKAINDLLWDLKGVSNTLFAIYWGRLYGRGGILLGAVDGGGMATELRPENILPRGTDALRYIEPLENREFQANTLQNDPTKPGFGEPETWRMTRVGGTFNEDTFIHTSRIILTGSTPTSRRRRSENDWRDFPLLQPIINTGLAWWDQAIQAATTMVLDSSQAVLKIKDFLESIATEPTANFSLRMRIMEMGRALRILTIDADEEDFDYVERTFTGVKDILDHLANNLSGIADIPATILFGRSPAGENATGESDQKIWDDQVTAAQQNEYQPILEKLVYLAALATGATEPEAWGVEFLPLHEMSEKEMADLWTAVATTDKTNIDAQVYTPEEVALHRYAKDEPDPSPLQIEAKSRELMLEAELKQLEEDIRNPQPDTVPPVDGDGDERPPGDADGDEIPPGADDDGDADE